MQIGPGIAPPSLSPAVRLTACALVLCACAAFLIVATARVTYGIDHGLFYYSTQMILAGEDPYQPARVLDEWKADGAPAGLDPRQYSGFVNPLSVVLLFL